MYLVTADNYIGSDHGQSNLSGDYMVSESLAKPKQQRNRKSKDKTERFWPKVIKGPEENDCWQWIGAKTKLGYGIILASSQHGKARNTTAHRMSWEIANGQNIPEGMIILHVCDNPPCTNPRHLMLGTSKDNTQDMLAKDRYPIGNRHYTRRNPSLVRRGLQNPNCKLTEPKILIIKHLRNEMGISFPAIAEFIGVTRKTCERVASGELWAHVTGKLFPEQLAMLQPTIEVLRCRPGRCGPSWTRL